ncbi:MAG: outer membrane beta-barrel protein [Novosphingobium sp.]|uniref:outer membrane beta-barrel protein n=1 Tax=Novosphingobium sp. TaxID=1874826 RepID=UPI0032BDBDC8
MKKLILPLLASLAVASPAFAEGGEARAEVRGGVAWSGGSSQDVWGAAAGYDFDLGQSAFAGFEVSGDKIGVSGTKVGFGLTGRLGAKVGANAGTRVYGTGGYTTEYCTGCGGTWTAGGGLEQTVSGKVYVKVEYRHAFDNNFSSSLDAVVGGVGVRF